MPASPTQPEPAPAGAALHATQQRLFDALLAGTGGRAAGEAAALHALPLLAAARGPDTAQRLQIYRNNLIESLTGALGAVYPVLAQLVGEAYFRQLARQFIAAHPLRAGNLQGFGREMAALLRELPSAAGLPYLADVAALEWAWHEVYHEADAAPLDPARLSEVPAEQQLELGLQLVPAARLVRSAFPVLRIWQAHQADADPALPLSLDAGATRVLVLRRALEIEFVLLGDAEAHWLGALAAGATLAEATVAALGMEPGFDLAAALGRHLALGSFAALSFGALPLAPSPCAAPPLVAGAAP